MFWTKAILKYVLGLFNKCVVVLAVNVFDVADRSAELPCWCSFLSAVAISLKGRSKNMIIPSPM
jgi:hypothetical protein